MSDIALSDAETFRNCANVFLRYTIYGEVSIATLNTIIEIHIQYIVHLETDLLRYDMLCVWTKDTRCAIAIVLKYTARGRYGSTYHYCYNMAISRIKKETQVAYLREMAQQGVKGSLVFVSFRNISAKQFADMHLECFKKNISFKVAKKTLIRKAFESIVVKGDTPSLDGEVAIFSGDDAFEPARTIASFPIDKTAIFAIIGGIYEGEFIGADKMNEISNIPDKEILYGRLVGMLQTPLRQCVVVLGQISIQKH